MSNMHVPTYSIAPHSNAYRDLFCGDRDTADFPSASVVVNTYNKLPLLKRCMTALLAQTWRGDWDVILVDDGSDDGTQEWASALQRSCPIVRYIRQEDIGYRLARARNLGIEASTKDVIVFLDGDLIPSPNWLYNHVAPYAHTHEICVTGIYYNVAPSLLSEAPSIADLESARVRDRWRGKREDWREQDISDSDELNAPTRMPIWFMVCGGNTSYSRERLIDAGGFDPCFEGWGAEDNDMAFRYYANGNRIVPSYTALAYHQDHPFDRVARQEQVERNVELLKEKSLPPLVTCITQDAAQFAWIQETLSAWPAKTELVWYGDGCIKPDAQQQQ
jgi:glycosyltransferase involved in cell wall biosynthesis